MMKGDWLLAAGISLVIALIGLVTPIELLTPRVVIAQTAEAQKKAEADRLLQLGIDQHDASQFEVAFQTWQQALKLYREIKNRLGEGQSLGNLGNAYYSLGQYEKAIEYQQQSLAILRELKDRLGEGQSLGNLGNAYYSLGQYAKAIEYQQQSLAILRELKDRLAEGAALSNLGLAYYSLGQYAKAIEYQQQGLSIARKLKDRLAESQSLGNLGVVYYFLGQYEKSIEYQQQRLTIAKEIKDRRGEGNALGNLGLAYHSLNQYDKAIEYYQQSLAIFREIKDRRSEGGALGNLGLAYHSLNQYDKVIEYQKQSLAIFREIKDRRSEGNALGNLGLARFRIGAFPQAEQDLFAAIAVLESLRENLQNSDKVSLADTQRNPYNNLQRVLIAQNKVEVALEVAERGRARAFVELLAKRVQPTTSSAPTAIAIPAIQQLAKAKQATLVQYSILDDIALFIWVVQPSGQIAFRQVDLTPLKKTQNTTLENLVNTARCFGLDSCQQYFAKQGTRQVAFNQSWVEKTQVPTFKTNDSAFDPKYLRQLHQLLIAPIADLLPKDVNAPVILIPQGSLFLVPFAALQDDQGKYLIDRHTILTAPSIQVLQLTQQQRQRIKQANLKENLVVGNPTMPRLFFPDGQSSAAPPPLPGAETEAKAIAPLLRTRPLIGVQATEAEVVRRMPRARIIHLATHGIFDNQQALQSAIALAPVPNSKDRLTNGWLTADKILDLNLQAELVVLSACDTGRGRITGDGVIGLSRSLISAGVPSVVVSLWSVPDAPTASLMTQFYQNLQRQPNKAIALREAMLATKQEHPHPKDWAAFVLIGEME